MDAKVGEKYLRTKAKILRAAETVVARIGYDKAAVSEITAEAGVATGLFYYYFPNREELLNQLLPSIGEELIDFIGHRVRPLEFGIEREIASFEAYFDFLAQRPSFYRVFSEAQVYTPRAYETHFRIIMDNYVAALKQQKRAGFIDAPDSHLLPLAYSLTGIRNYLTQLLAQQDPELKRAPRSFTRIYRQFLTKGVFVS
ncbi:MAG: TetR/AcrR family transcriptional regulator [Lautropia sp.]